jgi:uncharacterized protein YidB (DUF937 family)
MGFLDILKGASKKTETAASTGAAAGTGAAAAEESAISGLLGAGGSNLTGLLDKLKLGGLEDTAKSWVGKGENKAISGEQVKAALGKDEIAAVASKLGVSEDVAVGKIAKVLPGVIDKLTPDGLVPDPDAIAKKLTGLFK